MRGAQSLLNGAEKSRAKSRINCSLITSFLAYMKWNGSFYPWGCHQSLPLRKLWNFVHLYVMKHPFTKIHLCVMIQLLLPLNTKIAACSTYTEFTSYCMPGTGLDTGNHYDTTDNLGNRIK